MKTTIIIILIILILLINTISIPENFKVFNTVTAYTPKSNINLDNFYRISIPTNDKPSNNVCNFLTNCTTSVYQNRFNFLPSTINNINLTTDSSLYTNNNLSNDNSLYSNDFVDFKSNNCCLVSKELENNNSFSYNYTKLKDDQCDINKYELDQNNQLFFDGINGWNNNMCQKDSGLGSCKHYNFECIDFVDKKTCDYYNSHILPNVQNKLINFTWSNKPCYQK